MTTLLADPPSAGAVIEADLSGSNPQFVTNPHPIASGQNGPIGVAVNSSNLYWADSGAGTIMEAGLDGSNPQPIVSGQTDPVGVALGP